VLPQSPELKRIAEVEADYVLIGHTHKQMVSRVGTPLVVNPGSVGQGRDHSNGRKLSYAVLDATTGEVTFDDYTVAEHLEDQQAAACGGGLRQR
jgi:predicted phosphodiesterase